MKTVYNAFAEKFVQRSITLQTDARFLSTAIYELFKNPDRLEQPEEMDAIIFLAYTRYLIMNYTNTSREKLLSPLVYEIGEGCSELEPISYDVFDQINFTSCKDILKTALGEAPLLKIHLKAVHDAYQEVNKLKATYANQYLTHIILNHCGDLLVQCADVSLMIETNFSQEQMLTVLAAS